MVLAERGGVWQAEAAFDAQLHSDPNGTIAAFMTVLTTDPVENIRYSAAVLLRRPVGEWKRLRPETQAAGTLPADRPTD